MYLIFRQLQFSRISCRVLLLACAVQLSTRVSDCLTVPRRPAAASSLVPPPLAAPFPAGVHVRIPTGSPEAVSSAVLSTEYSSTAPEWIPVPFSQLLELALQEGGLGWVAGKRRGSTSSSTAGRCARREGWGDAHRIRMDPARALRRAQPSQVRRALPCVRLGAPWPPSSRAPSGVGSATAACVAPGPSTPRRRGRCGRPSPPARTCGWRWGWRR